MTRSPLDNPEIAAIAWSRYKRLLKRWSLVTLAVCLVTIAYLAWEFGLRLQG